jgi:predicted amidophosphoribosyltransferase
LHDVGDMLAELIGLVAPPCCALCGGECAARARLCERCELRLGGLRPRFAVAAGLDATWSAAPYQGIGRELVMALKFGARPALAEPAAAAIAEWAPGELLAGEIVPVPPAPWRLRWRGFDSADEIAIALGARTGLLVRRCLRRSEGRRQVGRPRGERLGDPPRVRASGPAPRRAVLVDDVVTTGATLGACARALRSAGSGAVVAVTFAGSGQPIAPPPPRCLTAPDEQLGGGPQWA